MDKQQHQQ